MITIRVKYFIILAATLLMITIWIHWASSNTQIPIVTYKQIQFPNYFYINQFAIVPSLKCSENTFLTIIVTSYVGHVELRSAHRRTMPLDYLIKNNISRIFLLSQIPQNEKLITQNSIEDESNVFGDILQGKFIENYRNLTYKHLMGLHWASSYCNKATYILKVDDDTVFNINTTIKLLYSLKQKTDDKFLMGYMLNNTVPRRQAQNKWYVTWEEYEYRSYPHYLSGWYYITTPKVAKLITEMAKYNKYFWIDDILVTGILTEILQISLKQVPNNYWLEYYELLECCLRDMVLKNIKCSYVVGPNGGRNNLIVEFNEAVRHCDQISNCRERVTPLKKDCIAFRDRAIFSDGKPRIEKIKL